MGFTVLGYPVRTEFEKQSYVVQVKDRSHQGEMWRQEDAAWALVVEWVLFPVFPLQGMKLSQWLWETLVPH